MWLVWCFLQSFIKVSSHFCKYCRIKIILLDKVDLKLFCFIYSGVDLGYYLRQLGVSDNVVKHVTESNMGHIAVAWALYKIATPVRYAVTLGKAQYYIFLSFYFHGFFSAFHVV